MFYTFLFVSILFYSYKIKLDEKEEIEFIKYYLPIFLLLFLTFAFQWNVGTDYFSYYQGATNDGIGLFKLNQFIQDKEYLFALLVRASQISGFPQLIFILSSFLQNICLMFSLYFLRKNNININFSLFLYFSLSLCFFNQFNGIRQFISVNIIILSFFMICDNKRSFIPWLFMLMAPFFHQSAWIMIVYFILMIIVIDILPVYKWIICIISILFLGIYFFDINSVILFIVERTGMFTEYLNSSYVDKMSFVEIATKIVKLIVVFYSIFRLDLHKLSIFETRLLKLSNITILVMILSFSSSLVWRMYLYFDFFLIIPVLLFFKYNARKEEKILISLYLLSFLFLKIIILPRGEYLYNNYFMRYLYEL